MSKEQMQSISDEMMKKTPKQEILGMMPKPEDMPGPYCAIGIADCKDLNFGKMCIYNSCHVLNEFNLTRAKHNELLL